ncbi:MAG: GNAT family N-acetyltransferase [Bacteroidales bacterium]|nr:GNAT family N-acetyltransferase [Bacteroidales bacterium]
MSDPIWNRILFRDFKPADFPSIHKLWELNNMAGQERGNSADTILNCNKQGGKFIILEIPEEKKIIGTSWLTWDGRRIFLHHFCIHPDYRGRGLGELLGRESLEFISKKGAQVKLEVHKKNIPAKRLYEKLGFIVFEEYDIYMKRES